MKKNSLKVIFGLFIIASITILIIKNIQGFSINKNNDQTIFNQCLLANDLSYLGNLKQRRICWNNLLEETFNKNGLKEAYKLFSEIYAKDPVTRNHCHEWAHTLGNAAYKVYVTNKNIELVPETTYCENGFYQGFIAALILDTGNPQKAIEFCQMVDEKFGSQIKTIKDECLSPVGAGIVQRVLQDKKIWGNFEKTAYQSLVSCRRVFSSNELDDCYNGVFYDLTQEIAQSTNGFSLDEYLAQKDPLFDCNNLQNTYQGPCLVHFTDLIPLKYGRYGFYEATRILIKDIKNVYFLHQAIERLSRYYAGFDIYFNCHDLQDTYQEPCVTQSSELLPLLSAEINLKQASMLNESLNRTVTIERLLRYYTGHHIVIPNNNNFVDDVQECRRIPASFFKDCLQGIIHRISLSFNIQPEIDSIRVLAFCQADYFTVAERDLCTKLFMQLSKESYGGEIYSNICNKVDRKYQQLYCQS